MAQYSPQVQEALNRVQSYADRTIDKFGYGRSSSVYQVLAMKAFRSAGLNSRAGIKYYEDLISSSATQKQNQKVIAETKALLGEGTTKEQAIKFLKQTPESQQAFLELKYGTSKFPQSEQFPTSKQIIPESRQVIIPQSKTIQPTVIKIQRGIFDNSPQYKTAEYYKQTQESLRAQKEQAYQLYKQGFQTGYSTTKKGFSKLGFKEESPYYQIGSEVVSSIAGIGTGVYKSGFMGVSPSLALAFTNIEFSYGPGGKERTSALTEQERAQVGSEFIPLVGGIGSALTESLVSSALTKQATKKFILKQGEVELKSGSLTPEQLNLQIESGKLTGNKLTFASRINPDEKINFQAELKPKKIGENLYSIGNIKLRQYLPGAFAEEQQGTVSRLLFNPTIKQVRKPSLVEIRNIDPLIINEAGQVINKPRFIAVKLSTKRPSRTMKVAELVGGTSELDIRNFKTFPHELKRQILTTYEKQYNLPISEDRFYNLYKDSGLKFSVSYVEGKKLGSVSAYTENILGQRNRILNLRFAPSGKKITRTGLFDENKLILSGDLIPFDVYKSKTSFRDITMPEIGKPRKVRYMTGETKVYKALENDFPDSVGQVISSNLIQKKKVSTKQVQALTSSVKAATEVLIPQKPIKLPTSKARSVSTRPDLVRTELATVLSTSQVQQQRVQQIQQQRQVQRLLPRQISLNKVSQLLSTSQVQVPKTKQQQRQVQRQIIVSKQLQRQSLTQISKIGMLTTPRSGIYRFPIPLFKPRIRAISKSKKISSKKRKQREFALTPTLRQQLTGVRSKRPIRLSKLTGFETITL